MSPHLEVVGPRQAAVAVHKRQPPRRRACTRVDAWWMLLGCLMPKADVCEDARGKRWNS
jgi:hypothetical protein